MRVPSLPANSVYRKLKIRKIFHSKNSSFFLKSVVFFFIFNSKKIPIRSKILAPWNGIHSYYQAVSRGGAKVVQDINIGYTEYISTYPYLLV